MTYRALIPSLVLCCAVSQVSAATVAEVIDGLLIQQEQDVAARSDAAFLVAQERQRHAVDLDQAYLDLDDAYRRLEAIAQAQVALQADLAQVRTERDQLAADSANSPGIRQEMTLLRERIQALRKRIQEGAIATTTSTDGDHPIR